MPTTALNFAPGLVPATETNIFTVPVSTEYDLPVIRFVNNDALNPHQLTIWNKTSVGAGTDADKEAVLTIQPQSTYEHGPNVLPAGRTLSVMADVAGMISMRPHGWAIT